MLIYLDHNVLHYLIAGFPGNVDSAAEHAALDRLVAKQDCKFAVSFWNLIEISREYDSAKYIELLSRLKILWFGERLFIQHAELLNFIESTYYKRVRANAKVSGLLNSRFDQAVTTIPQTSGTLLIGESFDAFVKHLTLHRSSQRILRDAEANTPRALEVLRVRRADRSSWLALEDERLISWLKVLLPERDGTGQFITIPERELLAKHCFDSFDACLIACPTVAAEHYLFDKRTIDEGRKARSSDAADLMHAVLAIPHCDIFVTHDKYLNKCAQYCAAKLDHKKAAIRRLLTEI